MTLYFLKKKITPVDSLSLHRMTQCDAFEAEKGGLLFKKSLSETLLARRIAKSAPIIECTLFEMKSVSLKRISSDIFVEGKRKMIFP